MLSQFFDGKELTRRINPDEVVAHGAAIEAASMSSDESMEYDGLIDVIPLSLGLQTAGGFMTTVLSRNTQLPAEHSMLFSTHKDNQDLATVKVFQGERLMARNNHFLGSFQIKGITPAPRGVPQIEVSFKVDASGLLAVEASERDSGKRSALAIEQDRFLGAEQIQESLKEADSFAKDDQRDFAQAEARMALKALVRSLHSAAEFASEEDAGIFLEAAGEGKDWLTANPDAEAEEIHEKREELEANVPDLALRPSAGATTGGGELDMEGHDEL
ncbi:hsp-3 [Symbiodinium pilosum]|uniref:Hsp-3 protein n=1 Tax=Symbiodinium pilosum TaxID=2952 RepID=A0A812T5N6_SYMPI|nr:hsp-3 [Symbiodinium pilosum]